MSDVRVANRYAKALLDLAQENNSLEEAHDDAHQFLAVCESSRDFEVILGNPVISKDKKISVVDKVFTGVLSEQTLKFVKLIINKQRGRLLVPIFNHILADYKAIKGIFEATAYSTVELSDKIKDQLKQVVQNNAKGKVNQVDLVNQMDPSLLGGFVLKFEDQRLDKSVSTQLKSINKVLKN